MAGIARTRGIALGRRRQGGVATLFIILMVGMAVTTSVMFTVHSLRSAQQRHLTTHATTSAQAAAWRGVEIVRLALSEMAEDPLGRDTLASWAEGEGAFGAAAGPWAANATTPTPAGWAGPSAPVLAPDGGLRVDIAGESGIHAHLIEISRLEAHNSYRLRAYVSGEAGDGTAATRSTVEVIYELGAGSGGSGGEDAGPPFAAAINFVHDLHLSGSITIRKDPGTTVQINVDGDLTTGGNSITGVDTIWSTGSVRISSGSSFGTLRANGDILFDGSVSVNEAATALGDVCVRGGASGATILANGSVYADGGVGLGDVAAIGSSQRGDRTAFCTSSHRVNIGFDVDGRRYAVDLQGNAGARSVRAGQSVRINSGSITQEQGLLAAGHLVDTNWGGRQTGIVGKTVTGPNPDIHTWVRSVAGYQVPIAPASPVVLDAPSFNAYDVENQANYVFKVDGNGYRVVTVRNVHGIEDDTYFIADYPTGPHKDHLCKALTPNSNAANPVCANPLPQTAQPICRGHSEWNRCLYYEAGARQWRLDGQALAPGVAWFEGNLQVGNGTYYNTMVATGHISTSGSARVFSVTFAGFEGGVRQEDWNQIAYSGICVNDRFPGRYPTDWCDFANRKLAPPDGSVLGHYALLAGSYDAEGRYNGGNIALGSSVNVFGSVLAGNLYSSGGSTTIRGSVTALAQGGGNHGAGGSTTIDLRGMPLGYDPLPQPCQLTGSCGGEEEAQPATPAQVRWSRYL